MIRKGAVMDEGNKLAESFLMNQTACTRFGRVAELVDAHSGTGPYGPENLSVRLAPIGGRSECRFESCLGHREKISRNKPVTREASVSRILTWHGVVPITQLNE